MLTLLWDNKLDVKVSSEYVANTDWMGFNVARKYLFMAFPLRRKFPTHEKRDFPLRFFHFLFYKLLNMSWKIVVNFSFPLIDLKTGWNLPPFWAYYCYDPSLYPKALYLYLRFAQ